MGDLISRQAAIEALKYNQDVYSHNFHDDPIDKYTTAIIAADIDTLVKLPSAQPEPCGEVVSREVLVKFFDDWMSALDINCHHQSVADLRIIKGDIKNLPSAQPEKHDKRTETHACDLISRQAAIEAIAYSIELCNKALDSMTLGDRDRYAVEVERNSLLKLKDDFKLLPSAQPDLNEWCTDCKEYDSEKHHCPRYNRVIREALNGAEPRKPGRWSFIGEDMFECTSCGVVYTTEQLNGLRNYDTDPYAPKFCPNCGADMRGNDADDIG